jgi:hypothetical protein
MTVPVFITYRDRRTMLDRTLRSYRERGFEDITVVDNDSVKVPTLPYGVKIVHADNSHRQLAPWLLDLVPDDSYYIVADGDIELDCPPDVAEHLVACLETFPQIEKIGLGIRVDDLLFPPPQRYGWSYLMEYSVERGTRYKHIAPGIIDAPSDTHFAMHRPGSGWPGIVGARTTAPYLCRHLPWYNEEYSDEEKLYYERAGKAWTMGHSAETLLEMAVAVPFVSLRQETVVALHGKEVRYAPMTSDSSYWELLRDLWAAGQTFAIVEQDIVVAETTLDELRLCDGDWCAMPFPYRGNPRAFSLACTKFSAALIARHPDLMAEVAEMWDEKHPPRHWCRMDAWLFGALIARGERRCEHVRSEPVGHVGAQVPSHGCLVDAR